MTAGGETRERLLSGTVEASRRVELAFQVPGVLAKLPVREGQNVAKGELIAQLRQDEFEAQLKTRQSQLDQARAALAALRAGERPEQRRRLEAQVRSAAARLANARTEFNRFSQLLQSGAISRQEFDTVRTAYLVAQEDHESARQLLEKGSTARAEDIDAQEAEVRGLEARVVDANLQLQDATLVAPYDGVIAQRFVEPNQNVRAKQPIVRFQDVDEIDIAVDVPETLMAADIQSADIVQMTAELAGAPGVQFPVHIREVAQQADPTTQTYRMRVAMKVPPGLTVLPGMTATVSIAYRRASILGDQILVPVSAVLKDASGAEVAWVIGKDDVVQRRPVTVGAATGNAIEITDGLQPGDRIAVAGVRFLRDGMTVRDLGDALGAGQS
ncbi:MAG TPA: efflux RND transporter periplasmic adaptor subunit [Candidatus Dormibacteraeota bacterium]|nr:efflux RND transporter periplasmic adaptor subunit [Candidatus Dormibacteraeota bacterium]